MLQIITCTHCHGSSPFDIHLEADFRHDHCSCGHQSYGVWRFYFCTLDCFLDWMKKKKVSKVGIPCQGCIGPLSGIMGHKAVFSQTGFSSGFRSNGICRSCKGKKAVRVRQKKAPVIPPKKISKAKFNEMVRRAQARRNRFKF